MQVVPGSPLANWGRSLQGDPRVVVAAAVLGVLFFGVLWATQAQALGAARLPLASALAGAVSFGGLWSAFGLLAVSGFPRAAIGSVVGHLLGFVLLAANLVLARADGMDSTFAVAALFGFTFLGLLGGVPFEVFAWWRARTGRAA